MKISKYEFAEVRYYAWKFVDGALEREKREDNNARLDEAAFAERVTGIEKATAALKEAKVEDEKIIYLLQKYWIYALARQR